MLGIEPVIVDAKDDCVVDRVLGWHREDELPFEPERLPDLSRTSVFIGAGERDPMASRETVERLATALREGGASVTMHWTNGGHTVTKEEIAAAQEWILKTVS